MLELKHIVKDYLAGENTVHALKGIDLAFRDSEFVSILGPSGCGKTTLLNIVGGLDGYTDGDLIINGKTTKAFLARDWDAYRNHSIGFVFQSYNLIPHQTVLQNVELALTLSGVSKNERRERAIKALEEVGLGNQIDKKPNQLSGGQMQRVAIARALVNNPDIILADEPTGALDTETSVQVMEILKKVSSDRLVIMVTHNPELAEKYSSRIIRMLDGNIVDDSRPINADDKVESQVSAVVKAVENEKRGKNASKKPSMSFFTAFRLSLKNLFTKKGRTFLTAFAGSIGIIGIALILAVSQGTTGYINTVQEETLAEYPVSIQSTSTDFTALMETFMNMGNASSEHENDAVYKKPFIYSLANAVGSIQSGENDLRSFKSYIDEQLKDDKSKLGQAVSGVQYSYDLELLVYTEHDGKVRRSDSTVLMQELLKRYAAASPNMGAVQDSMMGMFMGGGMRIWQELLPAKNGGLINDILTNQYDVVYGRWPSRYDEIVLVLDENNELDDISLYLLGLLGDEVIDDVVGAVVSGNPLEIKEQNWSYEDICNTPVKIILNSECYAAGENGLWRDLRENEASLSILYGKATSLKISGIIKPNEKATNTMLGGTICYTTALTEYVVEKSSQSNAVKAQLESKNEDILTGLPFKNSVGSLTATQKKDIFDEYVAGLNTAKKATLYENVKCYLPDSQLEMMTSAYISQLKQMSPDEIRAMIRNYMREAGLDENQINSIMGPFDSMEKTEDIIDGAMVLMKDGINDIVRKQYADGVRAGLAQYSAEEKAQMLTAEIAGWDEEKYAMYFDAVMEFSTSSYEQNLTDMGYIDLDKPTAINVYATSFENKDVIADAIKEYNNSVEEAKRIKYTDYVALMMSSITTIINAITYVLIAFVAVSLVVSSIMVGVITLISVQERTKEIGILRAIGASKRDVSSMFNAETIIIGFASGVFGVAITYLLCIPINLILHALTGIKALSAFLPPVAALILVAISVFLTLISGLIPSRSAAKKDPVVALRTE